MSVDTIETPSYPRREAAYANNRMVLNRMLDALLDDPSVGGQDVREYFASIREMERIQHPGELIPGVVHGIAAREHVSLETLGEMLDDIDHNEWSARRNGAVAAVRGLPGRRGITPEEIAPFVARVDDAAAREEAVGFIASAIAAAHDMTREEAIEALMSVVTRAKAKVKEGIEDPQWQFRSVDGLAEEFDIPDYLVEEVLTDPDGPARKSVLRDRQGRTLYTARDRKLDWREKVERFRLQLGR